MVSCEVWESNISVASLSPSVVVWCQIHPSMLWLGLYYFIHCNDAELHNLCRITIRTRIYAKLFH